jgi:ribosomal protein S25
MKLFNLFGKFWRFIQIYKILEKYKVNGSLKEKIELFKKLEDLRLIVLGEKNL